MYKTACLPIYDKNQRKIAKFRRGMTYCGIQVHASNSCVTYLNAHKTTPPHFTFEHFTDWYWNHEKTPLTKIGILNLWKLSSIFRSSFFNKKNIQFHHKTLHLQAIYYRRANCFMNSSLITSAAFDLDLPQIRDNYY